jgi:hypothetical protein
MNKIVTALTVLTLAMTGAAYAASPANLRKTAAPGVQQPQTTLTYSSMSSPLGDDAANPNVPGATGRTIVLGDPSTIAGDASATEMERTGAISR